MKLGHTLLLIPVVLVVLHSGCDDGMGPIVEPTGFSGVITYKNWPSQDSLLELRLVVFEEIPTDSAGLIAEVIKGATNQADLRAAIYPPLGPGHSVAEAMDSLYRNRADSVRYVFLKEGTWLKEKTYKYVVLAWRFGTNYFKDWVPAGVYSTAPDGFEPTAIVIRANRMREDVNISVDFHNLPPIPWRQ